MYLRISNKACITNRPIHNTKYSLTRLSVKMCNILFSYYQCHYIEHRQALPYLQSLPSNSPPFRTPTENKLSSVSFRGVASPTVAEMCGRQPDSSPVVARRASVHSFQHQMGQNYSPCHRLLFDTNRKACWIVSDAVTSFIELH